MIQLEKVFKNDNVDSHLKGMVSFVNGAIKKSGGVIEGKIHFKGEPKITIVADEATISNSSETILNFGVARCSPSDEFDKVKGRSIARWRAENNSILRIAVSNEISPSDLIALFNRNASFLNNMFKSSKNNHLLKECPEDVINYEWKLTKERKEKEVKV